MPCVLFLHGSVSGLLLVVNSVVDGVYLCIVALHGVLCMYISCGHQWDTNAVQHVTCCDASGGVVTVAHAAMRREGPACPLGECYTAACCASQV